MEERSHRIARGLENASQFLQTTAYFDFDEYLEDGLYYAM